MIPDEELDTVLIVSDPEACNENFSIYIRYVLDIVYHKDGRCYHDVSIYALKLLKLNLFAKNFEFCTAKIIAFLTAFASDPQDNTPLSDEKHCLEEFLCILLLLLLRLKNSSGNGDISTISDLVVTERLYACLSDNDFPSILANMIASNAELATRTESYPTLLKFCGDILFEYLLGNPLLSDHELDRVANHTNLINVLVLHLLITHDLNTYDLEVSDRVENRRLTVYEECKVLLLVNEQFLMRGDTSIPNKVFEALVQPRSSSGAMPITCFINLLIYYLNKDLSLIIKTLILKFLYQVFTTSFTTKLVYLNDLKILVDVFLRELTDLDPRADCAYLYLAYLKVLYPLLMFSQLSEKSHHYRGTDIMNIMSSIEHEGEENAGIREIAMRCSSIPWLKCSECKPSATISTTTTSGSFSPAKMSPTILAPADQRINYPSINSLTLNRTNSRRDYDKPPPQSHPIATYSTQSSISNVVDEILESEGGSHTLYSNSNSSSSLVTSNSTLRKKAFMKKAPPPPPAPSSNGGLNSAPKPPPSRKRRA